mmetsp:Transcript_11768/g.22677  ORF Transcript_11768/g.22677 Transcript_11768/m.22677 type:complete len:88 (+) Transcript_11768:458-721(+)
MPIFSALQQHNGAQDGSNHQQRGDDADYHTRHALSNVAGLSTSETTLLQLSQDRKQADAIDDENPGQQTVPCGKNHKPYEDKCVRLL